MIRKSALVILCLSAAMALLPSRSEAKESFWQKIFIGGRDKRRNVPTTVAGVRGLDENQVAGDPNARDYEALAKMEALYIAPAELEKFVSDGGLR